MITLLRCPHPVNCFSSLTHPSRLCSYLLVILSNQGGISLKSDSKSLKSDLKRLGDFKRKVTAVFTQLNLPISIYAATGRDRFRKPRTGMWEQLLEDFHLTVADQIDLDTSFFVGDAGGRTGPTSGGVSKDHSCCDRCVCGRISVRHLGLIERKRLCDERGHQVFDT